MKTIFTSVLLAFICVPAQRTHASAQTPRPSSADEAIHNELRAFRDSLSDALNKKDLDRILTHLERNVVITFQDAEVARGHEGVRRYYDKMLTGPGKIVQEYAAQLTVDELTILYGGDTGISFGSTHEHFNLTSGLKFDLTSRWTATLVKEDGRWLIASLHASTDLFNNPLLAAAKKTAIWASAIGLAVGLILGLIIGKRRQAK